MYALLKPILFRMQPEQAHHVTMFLLKLVLALPVVGWAFRRFHAVEDQRLERNVFGIKFPNPVGLAAGFDKDGKYYRSISALGFGFVEIGTVTPIGQDGNPQPRLFRLPADGALINRMGFNNEGVEALVGRLKSGKPQHLVIGGNIGKNKNTPNEAAARDYAICFEALFPYVDYFVVNVSSPNTPGLRELQEKAPLTALLTHLQQLNRQKTAPKPILLKIAPDLTNAQLDDILDIVRQTQLAGIIATNTTIARNGLKTSALEVDEIGAGGLSGTPVRHRSTEVIRYLYQHSQGKITIIGVGGIASAADAREKLEAGAALVQVYSGMVFRGPGLVKEILKDLIGGK